MIHETIEKKIQAKCTPLYLEVEDISAHHNVPGGFKSHFKVVLVSNDFNAMPILSRHRVIYQLLADQLAGPVYALALHIYTLKEWEELHDRVFAPPLCNKVGLKV